MVAHTGIAATLLINGSTVHRQFKVPLNATEESQCVVDTNSSLELKLRNTDVVIWDEATMSDRRVYECVDRLLRDIMRNGKPFGGKLMLLGGDWKQLLPVVRGLSSKSLVDYTLRRSELWPKFEQLELTENVRARAGGQEFADFLDEVGRGEPSVMDENGRVKMKKSVTAHSEEEIIEWTFGGGVLEKPELAKDRCILTTKNSDSLELNEKV